MHLRPPILSLGKKLALSKLNKRVYIIKGSCDTYPQLSLKQVRAFRNWGCGKCSTACSVEKFLRWTAHDHSIRSPFGQVANVLHCPLPLKEHWMIPRSAPRLPWCKKDEKTFKWVCGWLVMDMGNLVTSRFIVYAVYAVEQRSSQESNAIPWKSET